MRTRSWSVVGVLVLGVAVLSAACSDDPTEVRVVVSAASSLTDVFTEMEETFELANPTIDLVMNFGSSASLAEQIVEGAGVHVFASADLGPMDAVTEAGLSASTEVFASNYMTIAVPVGNPGGVVGLDDLARPELLIGLCAQGVPCGDLARKMLTAAGIEPSIDTEEPNVRALVTKLTAAELDAGIVYLTDVLASRSLEEVTVPEEVRVRNEYPIASLEEAPSEAFDFVDFVLGSEGRSILTTHGFGVP